MSYSGRAARTGSHTEDTNRDPVFDAYLAFLEEQMVASPDLLRPFTTADIAGLDELLEGVQYDKDKVLDEG